VIDIIQRQISTTDWFESGGNFEYETVAHADPYIGIADTIVL
jgi:hypothetical protein